MNGFSWKWTEIISVIFEIATKHCLSGSFVDSEGYSNSPNGSLPTVVDMKVIWIKFTHSGPFQFTDSYDVNVHSCHLLFDHFQFTLIHGPDIPDSSVKQFFPAPGFPSVTSHIHNHNRPLFLLWLCLLIVSGVVSPLTSVPYWAPTSLGLTSVSYLFVFLRCSWGSQSKNAEVVYHSLLQ